MRYKHNIQLYENDCGTACVISCLNYYGYTVDYEKIKKGINNNDYGTSINDIKTFFISNGFVSKIFKIDEPISKGLAFGASSHAIGTAKALEIGEVEGAMSSLAIAVSGILTVALSSLYANFM